VVTLLFTLTAPAQQILRPAASPASVEEKDSEVKKIEQTIKDVFRVKPRRPTVSRPADFNEPGALQIEYGYNGYYHARDFRAQDAGSLTVTFAATEQLGFEFDLDTVYSQKDAFTARTTGVGDAHVGVQIDISSETKRFPSIAASYFAKLPTASVSKDLGTGRVDHQISLLMSKTVGKTDFDFNAALLVNGKKGEKGSVKGGQFSFGFSRDLKRGFGVQGEFSGESKDADDPQGLYATGAVTYKLKSGTTFDFGLKFGLTPSFPRFGITAGIAFKTINLYKKRD
jgi:hypothetical protein